MKKLVALLGLTLVSTIAGATSYEKQLEFGVGPNPHVKVGPGYDLCMDRVDRVFRNVYSEVSVFLENGTARSGLSYGQLYDDGLESSADYLVVARAYGSIQSLEDTAVRVCGLRGYMSQEDADLLALYAETLKDDFESAMRDYAQSH